MHMHLCMYWNSRFHTQSRKRDSRNRSCLHIPRRRPYTLICSSMDSCLHSSSSPWGTRFHIQSNHPGIRTHTRCKRLDIRFRSRSSHLGTPIRNRSIP